MKGFMREDFLLTNSTAVKLYHEYAKDMPIIDYHCHLSPKEIYENKQFRNITDIWLDGDHYKWRLMRANGIEEDYITGNKSDYEKFIAWAKTVPMTIGNPLFHWTHLELQRFFNIDNLLNERTADDIWEKTSEKLADGSLRARDFITASKVEVVCTTDDPVDSLEYHLKIKELENFDTAVLPSFRPDKGLEINRQGFSNWVKCLEEAANISIDSYDRFLEALESRVRFFHSVGGRVSDHALDRVVYEEVTKEEAGRIFEKVMLQGQSITEEEERKYKTYTLIFLGKLYKELDWVMQFHIHALRNNSTKGFESLGPDTGYDAMDDGEIAKPLASLFNQLEREESLPKTVVYSLNPKDNPVIATVIGSFQGGGVPGKMQFGTAWWFNDQREGMLDQMKTLSNMGLFSQFIGMLTDSRSFLSYTRHEYFRRLVCDLVGTWVEQGEVPFDEELLERVIKGICYHNAKSYFNFPAYTVQQS
jgi:glucuronate isomerase